MKTLLPVFLVLAILFTAGTSPARCATLSADEVSVETSCVRQAPKDGQGLYSLRYEASHTAEFTDKNGKTRTLVLKAVTQVLGERVRDRAWNEYGIRTVDRDLVLTVSVDGVVVFGGEAEQDRSMHAAFVLDTGEVLEVRVNAAHAEERMVFAARLAPRVPDMLDNPM